MSLVDKLLNRLSFLLYTLIFTLLFHPALWASESEGEGGYGGIIWGFINLGILIFILYRLGQKPVKDFLRNRRESIRESIEKAQQTKEDVEKRYKEYSEKIANLDAHIEELYRTLREEGEKERKMIIEEAERFAERIKEQAKFAANQEAKKVMEQVRAEVADLIVNEAESVIRKKLNDSDQKRLIEDFVSGIEDRRV